MSDQSAVAGSTPAEVDVFNGLTPTLEEFNNYRKTGDVAERFKPIADSAPAADTPQESSEGEQPETASDSEPEQQQEKGKDKAKPAWQARVEQLEATIDKIKRGAGVVPKPASEPEPAKEQAKAPQTYADWKQSFDPESWVAEYGKKHPDHSYERANAAMFDHMIDVRDHFKAIDQQRESQAKELNAKVSNARSKYGENFDTVLASTVETILKDPSINATVKGMLNESEYAPELIYTLGSDPKMLEAFLRMSPGQQIRHIAMAEAKFVEAPAVTEEKEQPRDESGKFISKESPAKPKTQAPKPPTPVSGTSTGAFDVSDTSLSAEEWMRKRNAQLAK